MHNAGCVRRKCLAMCKKNSSVRFAASTGKAVARLCYSTARFPPCLLLPQNTRQAEQKLILEAKNQRLVPSSPTRRSRSARAPHDLPNVPPLAAMVSLGKTGAAWPRKMLAAAALAALLGCGTWMKVNALAGTSGRLHRRRALCHTSFRRLRLPPRPTRHLGGTHPGVTSARCGGGEGG